ncbi:MAG: DUF58 domain-containing protein [bacterium]
MIFDYFSPAFVKKLEKFQLASKKASLKSNMGELLAQRGQSLEFEEYKEYTEGDEFKHIDWNLYSRLDKLYVKVFKGERSLGVSVVLDASGSMGVPRKDDKFLYAKRIAIALAYMALIRKNKVKMIIIGGRRGKKREIVSETPFFQNVPRIKQMVAFMEDFKTGGLATFGESLQKTIYRNKDVGTLFMVSDFLVDSGAELGLINFLKARNFDINFIHIRGEHEINPSQRVGAIKVLDCETREEKTIFLSAANREKLKREFERREKAIKETCHRNRANYVLAETSTPIEDLIMKTLTRSRILR